MNILLLMTDQWPTWAFGHCGTDIQTPNIDKLATQGTVFANAFTSCPLCSPARGALLSSRWPCQTGFLDNCGTGYACQEPFSLQETTWLDAAIQSGYHTGYFGKWHLGYNGPILRGVHDHDEQYDHPDRYDPATDSLSYDKIVEEIKAAESSLRCGHSPFWGVRKPTQMADGPHRCAAKGVAFLKARAQQEQDQPFFLTVSLTDPHFPHFLSETYAKIAESYTPKLPANFKDTFHNKPEFHGQAWWPSMDTKQLDEKEWQRIIAFSQAHMTMADHALGLVLKALEDYGLKEDTAIIFLSDHGDMCGAHNRFDKGPYFYDEVWRIPLIVSMPGQDHARQDAFVNILDVGRTLFHWVGKPQPDADRPRAGRDLSPLVGTCERGPQWSDETYGVYDLYNGMSFAIRAIRTRRWKYVWNPQSINELYDLEDDPAELNNRYNDPSVKQQQEQLHQRLMAWMQSVGDDLADRLDTLPAPGTIVATGRMGP